RGVDDRAAGGAAGAGGAAAGADPSVLAAIGHPQSQAAVAAAIHYHLAGVPFVAAGATVDGLTRLGLQGVFRVGPAASAQARAAAAFALEQVGASAWVLHDRSVFGQGIADAFRDAFASRGGHVLGYRGVRPEDVDFGAVARQLQVSGARLAFFGGDPAAAAALVRALRAAGTPLPVLGGDSFDTPSFLLMLGPAAHGVYYASVAPPTDAGPARAWSRRYRQRYGVKPDAEAALAYDATAVVLAAVERQAASLAAAGSTATRRALVRQALAGTADYRGIATDVAFGPCGDNRAARVAVLALAGTYPGRMVWAGTAGPEPVEANSCRAGE
ncbi:MAG: branched-chain amino acid ABC transporter substrate-binding protein, partial [Clostridia bacterium]|nr:branched-chain amino acid ABC transporter substrate-binding protein [Clostridia bacterium]